MTDLSKYPMVEAVLTDAQACNPGTTTDANIRGVYERFEELGPWGFCKLYNLLVNNSGEEFAIQWMGFYNSIHPGTY